jgi:hypothetical protein
VAATRRGVLADDSGSGSGRTDRARVRYRGGHRNRYAVEPARTGRGRIEFHIERVLRGGDLLPAQGQAIASMRVSFCSSDPIAPPAR